MLIMWHLQLLLLLTFKKSLDALVDEAGGVNLEFATINVPYSISSAIKGNADV